MGWCEEAIRFMRMQQAGIGPEIYPNVHAAVPGFLRLPERRFYFDRKHYVWRVYDPSRATYTPSF